MFDRPWRLACAQARQLSQAWAATVLYVDQNALAGKDAEQLVVGHTDFLSF
jgi:hypothetical protein